MSKVATGGKSNTYLKGHQQNESRVAKTVVMVHSFSFLYVEAKSDSILVINHIDSASLR